MVEAVLTTDWNKIKNLDDFNRQWPSFSADVGISALTDVFARPSCDNSISDLDDINGFNGYYEPVGKFISRLDHAYKCGKNDLFLVSQLSSSRYVSNKLSYSELSSKLFYDVFENLKVKSMAYRNAYEFAISSHNHDSIYSRIKISINPKYIKTDAFAAGMAGSTYVGDDNVIDVCSCWISTDNLTCDDQNKYESVTCNPAHNECGTSLHIWKIPKAVQSPPPRPMIGTIRFVGVPALRKLIENNNLVVEQTANSSNVQTYQVNPYDESGNIRSDYDGWVFANGTVMTNNNEALSAAANVYAGSSSSNFTVPCFDQFFKPNCGTITSPMTVQPYQVGLKQHMHMTGTHKFDGKIKLDKSKTEMYSTKNCNKGTYVHQGDSEKGEIEAIVEATATLNLNTSLLQNVTTTKCQAQGTEPYPKHQIIPVMIYIGGETDQFYEK